MAFITPKLGKGWQTSTEDERAALEAKYGPKPMAYRPDDLRDDARYYGVNPVFGPIYSRGSLASLVGNQTPPITRSMIPDTSPWHTEPPKGGWNEDSRTILEGMNPISGSAYHAAAAMDEQQAQSHAGFPVTPLAGAPGPTGMNPDDPLSQAYTGVASAGAPNPQATGESTFQAGQPQNALQRQQTEAQQPPAMRQISPARRYFWGTGRIDARAPLSDRSAPTNFDATFGANAPHMGAPSVTWQERQSQNQQHVADASAQRGLDWSPY